MNRRGVHALRLHLGLHRQLVGVTVCHVIIWCFLLSLAGFWCRNRKLPGLSSDFGVAGDSFLYQLVAPGNLFNCRVQRCLSFSGRLPSQPIFSKSLFSFFFKLDLIYEVLDKQVIAY